MTDKEKEAVKFFYNLRATIDESIMLFDEDINVKCGKETIKQITTVLNLIQTQQAEIEKKDRQIDKMAGYICATAYDNIIKKLKDDDIAYWGVEGSIKQYFERKVEEDK